MATTPAPVTDVAAEKAYAAAAETLSEKPVVAEPVAAEPVAAEPVAAEPVVAPVVDVTMPSKAKRAAKVAPAKVEVPADRKSVV